MRKAISNPTLGNTDVVQTEYFNWLCDQIDRRQSKHESRELASLLHSIEFRPLIPNDDNRAEDGKSLRARFLEDANLQETLLSFDDPCTVLEMLVALAKKLDFTMTEQPRLDDSAGWFWEMVDNLRLNPGNARHDLPIIQKFVNREYSKNGEGNIFPLKHPHQDQRNVEIWYQMMAYVQERYPE